MLSKDLAFFEDAFDVLNKQYFEGALSKPIITIQASPKAFGHFTCYEAWQAGETGYYEINIGAESLNRPLTSTMATLLHEMVHQYNHTNGIQDTSRSGVYHNKRFKEEAERRDLIITKNDKHGYSTTKPGPGLEAFCAEHWEHETDLHRKPEQKAKKKKPSSTRKYVCPYCDQSVRATKEVRIICGDCGEAMEVSL